MRIGRPRATGVGRGRAVLGVAAAVALYACGGNDEPAAPSSVSTPTGLAVVSATVIHDPAPVSELRAKSRPKMPRAYQRSGILGLTVAPDGNTLATTWANGSVQLFDLTGRHPARQLAGHGAATPAAEFSADGKHLVSVGRDSLAHVWSVASGERLATLRGHEHPIRALAATRDAGIIATGGDETRVMLWNGTTGQLRGKLSGEHTSFVNALAFRGDAQVLASGDAQGHILLWDVRAGRLIANLRGHANEVNAVAFAPAGGLLASADEEGQVLLWDSFSGARLASLPGAIGAVRSLAFSPDGAYLVGGLANGRLVVWDATARSVARDIAVSSAGINALRFDRRDARRLFIGGDDGSLASWDVESGVSR
jgi:WD40 repeat protein